MAPTRNRRRRERLLANLFADLLEVPSQERLGRGVVVDVSLSGIGIETEADLPAGTNVDCLIEIPLKLRARVVRTIAGGQIKRYGLQLVGLNLWDKLVLKQVLKGSRKTSRLS
jgi:hypothetical protein